MSTPCSEPFAVRDGRLFLEDCPLEELAAGLEEACAWVLSDRALDRALAGAAVRAFPVGLAAAPEVVERAARAGGWARVFALDELRRALDLGFPPDRVAAGGAVKDDRFVMEAVSAGVAVLEPEDAADRENVARIAAALGAPVPAPEGAPPTLEPAALGGCGGLLALVLAPPPDLALDAACAFEGEVEAIPMRPGEPAPGTVRGLSSARRPSPPSAPASVHGPVARGGWVVVPSHRCALGAGTLPRVLVRGAAWRPLRGWA